MTTVQGACLCGKVRYEITPPVTMMMNCHCSMCRKHHGAPFATFAAVPASAFRWLSGEEALGSFQSSEQGHRFFCTTCGSVAPIVMGDVVAFPAGNLQGDLGMKPQAHMFVGSKAPWYRITDDLPQHAGYPPEFGGGMGVERPATTPKPDVLEGSCLCGDVRWEIGKTLRMMNCHCSRCRRGRSAAHTTNLFGDLAEFRWTRGESQVAEYKVPEARFFAVAFCKRCGSGVPRISRERNFVVIPAGALDSDPGSEPQAHIFVGSKASWYDITDAIQQYPELPPAI